MRVSNIVPINLWRVAAEDVQIGSYFIPKGTTTMAEVSVIMKDPKVFEEPEKFNPHRFIDSPQLEQQVCGFGLGKRACPGESMARAELYLVLANFASRFDFRSSTSKPPGLIAKDENGTIRRSLPFNLIASKRN